jgi:uracil-DNA glycosylase
VDAREQLRRYLEQRREAGETELVLDGLSVEDALRLLGARAERGATPREGAARPETPADWRAALRDTGAAPSPAASEAVQRRSDLERAPAPVADAAPAPAAADQPAPPVADQAPPVRRGEFVGAEGAPVGGPATRPDSHATVPLDRVPTGYVIGSAGRELFGEESAWTSLDDVARAVAGCRACPLHATAKRPVPGEGSPTADLVCVGEAPGANEDEQGRPFVGQAGQLLTKILAAINLPREDVFICNVLKHRPPGNRNPAPSEVEACTPYLVRQIELLQPRVIVAFGTFAAQTLLQTRDAIGKLRGKIHHYHGVPLVVTYHPAALLRNPSWKRPTWEDVQLARRLLDRARGA